MTPRSTLSNHDILNLAKYIIETESTVRAASEKWNISKSTVHYSMSKILLRLNPELHLKVQRVFEKNKQERASRGGKAIRRITPKKEVLDEDSLRS
jgi:putative DeoR family transcriptional regulator (stage III sporulation protein D)